MLGFQVIVQDFVSKTIVAQFRAHSSPLSALAFDPSGTILVTASVYGHNLNVFRLTPPSTTGANTAALDASTSFAHLYKLYRGVTNAVSAIVFVPHLLSLSCHQCYSNAIV
jgi:WD40 repeat protein